MKDTQREDTSTLGSSSGGHRFATTPVRRARIRTTKALIAEYWLGTAEGRARLPDNTAAIDPGEPCCFACGSWAANADAQPTLWTVWNKAYLDRCHLVPRMLGGADTPANLVLLCSDCHHDAPNVGDPRYMLQWIAARDSFLVREHRLLQEALNDAQLSDEYARIAADSPQVFIETYRDLYRTWTGMHGTHVNYATRAAVLIETIRRVADIPSESAG